MAIITPGVVGTTLKAAFNAETRTSTLDSKVHFIPLNIGALNVTLSHVLNTTQEDVNAQGYGSFITIPDLRRKIVTFVEGRHSNKLYLDSLPEDFSVNPTKYMPAVVYYIRSGNSVNNIAGVIYPSYSSTYSGLFKEFIRHELTPYLKDTRYDTANAQFKAKGGKGFEKGFDIGHVYAQNIASTPVIEKINNLIAEIDTQLGTNTRGLISLKEQVLKQRSALKSQSKYGIKISGTLTKEVKEFLVSISANIVVIQDRLENQYEYGSQVEAVIKRAISGILAKVKFSPSVDDEIQAKIIAALQGKKTTSVRRVAKVPTIVIKDKITANVGISTSTTTKSPPYKQDPKLNQPNSPSNLLALLREKISARIQTNMGTGASDNILNYRSGRLANSVTIERLSTSREGMISVFYNYMRNPYGTFSEGGAQQSPKTRDPKALISKSIREIGASAMYSRMRAVLV